MPTVLCPPGSPKALPLYDISSDLTSYPSLLAVLRQAQLAFMMPKLEAPLTVSIVLWVNRAHGQSLGLGRHDKLGPVAHPQWAKRRVR